MHTVIVSCAKICIQTRLFTENLSHSVFTSGKTMGNFHSDSHSPHMLKGVHEHVLISQKMAQIYRTQNKGLEHAASSDGAGVVVVYGKFGVICLTLRIEMTS